MPMKPDAPTSPVVFEYALATSRQRESFFWGTIFLAIGLAPAVIDFIRPGSGTGDLLLVFLAAGLGLYLLSFYQMLTPDKQWDKRVALVFDQDGVGGLNLFKSIDERLSWRRVQSIEIDGAAVVVQFTPKDLTSNSPLDRRSQARLSVDSRQPEEIVAAIDKFWSRTN